MKLAGYVLARIALVALVLVGATTSASAQTNDGRRAETVASPVLIDVVVNLAKLVEFENTSADEIEAIFAAADFRDLDQLLQLLPDEAAVELHHSAKFTSLEGQRTKINSGQQTPVIVGAATNAAGGTTYSVQTMAAGLKLDISPGLLRDVVHVDINLSGVFLQQMEKLEGESFAHTQANTLECSTTAVCPPGKPAIIRLEENGDLWVLVVGARVRD